MNKKIIVADDEPGILEVINIILTEQGFEVFPIANSLEVVKTVKKIQPEVILLDLWMSGIDGEKITAILKKDPKTNHIPIIIISALNQGELIARKAGADNFLSKPFNINDLVNMVNKYIP